MSHKIERKDEFKCTLFDLKNLLWTCNKYFTNVPPTCAFATYHNCITERMMIEDPKVDKGRSYSRSD